MDLRVYKSSAFDLQQHLRVVGEFLEEENEAFHGLDWAVAGESAADREDLVEHAVQYHMHLVPSSGFADTIEEFDGIGINLEIE